MKKLPPKPAPKSKGKPSSAQTPTAKGAAPKTPKLSLVPAPGDLVPEPPNAKTCTVYQFPKRSRRVRPVDDDGQVLRRHRVLAEVPGFLAEVPGFLASVAVVMRERPDIPRAALVAAGRGAAEGARHTTPELVLSRAEQFTTRAAV